MFRMPAIYHRLVKASGGDGDARSTGEDLVSDPSLEPELECDSSLDGVI